MEQNKKNAKFSRVGIVLAAAGSAIGLGNIWRFPYMVGENGGSAFLLIYLLCVTFFGLPVVCAELFAGRNGLGRWALVRDMGVLAITIILGYYIQVAGWCIEFLLCSWHPIDPNHFAEFTTNPWHVFGLSAANILICVAVLLAGVKKGIERASKIMVPFLFVILMVMILHAYFLEGSHAGMRYLFQLDVSKITPQVILSALSQSFYSLSIGMGILVAYAGYMRRDQSLAGTSVLTIILDTLVAVLVGVVIFAIVFTFGINPEEGPGLVFVVLPMAFSGMHIGTWLQVLFFLLLALAALTSLVSMMEAVVSYLIERMHLSRTRAVALTSVVVTALVISVIIYPVLWDIFDRATALYLIPLGGLCFTIYVGWFCDRTQVLAQIAPARYRWVSRCIYGLIRYVAPIIILVIFINGIL